ncbi:T9SS type A sorting domain-containing protein [Polluticoccus soli]|uniref:T9SS type A sorting domain-containing protein n=1 Tax=Polluticoccus soli TaxID=3034150 RepID=UPI0023E1774D|nr:T9SS type A sorting domain-containing protein [Flavipsychrobacter sp. JY13-12]
MKQFFAGLLCLLPMLGFAQPASVSSSSNIAHVAMGQKHELIPAVTVTSDDMFVAHGKVQSGDESQLPTGDLDDVDQKIKVYPNPMGDCIFVETGFMTSGTMQCILYDAGGKQMMNMSFNVERGIARRIISASKLAAGTYFLHAMYNNGDVSSGTIFTIRKK